MMSFQKYIYCDNAATTKVRDEVIEAMLPYYNDYYGNASGSNSFAKKSKEALENSREIIAEIIGAEPCEIIFTSGGTESNNLAIQGYCRTRNNKEDSLLISKIEHDSVLRPCMMLEKEGWDFNTLLTDSSGKLLLDDLEMMLGEKTVLVSVMHANNEIGTIQPIKEISEILKPKNIVFHTDAVQSLGKIPFNVKDLKVDMASFSAHKMNGPMGVGALFVKKDLQLKPLVVGGGQEWKMRSGTSNVPAIVGFAKALELACKEIEEQKIRLNGFQTKIFNALNRIQNVSIKGSLVQEERLPGNIYFIVDSIDSDELLNKFDKEGIIVSKGSACSSHHQGYSRVLKAIGVKPDKQFASIRMSLGKYTTEDDCEHILSILQHVLLS